MGTLRQTKLLKLLTRICLDLSRGDKSSSTAELFELTKTDPGTEESDINRLAEAFGLLLVRLEARQMRTDNLIKELNAANLKLNQDKEELRKRNISLQKTVQETYKNPLIGQSPALLDVIKIALTMAKRPINTLILGPSGSGKEVLARMIFYRSPRAQHEFVAVNCSAIPGPLFESLMFGIEKGVATGVKERSGLILASSGGTLFLDEVADLTLENQAKLLRVLEEREVTPVGALKPMKVDLHVISATNKDLGLSVAQKEFREDLYYRLNVLKLILPPLAVRNDDILLLARHFLKEHSKRLGRPDLVLTPEIDALLLAYPWPGNVRELTNEMERLASLAQGPVVAVWELSEKIKNYAPLKLSLPDTTFNPNNFKEPSPTLSPHPKTLHREKITDDFIRTTLERHGGNKTQAARELGISREGLRKRLQRLR